MQQFLEARGICKLFPGVRALDDVDLQLLRGELLAVVGENGAGKSTLMKILGGVYQADAGSIRIDDAEVHIGSVGDAEKHGVVLIHQELNLAEHLNVAGNVFLGREPTWGGPLRLIAAQIYSNTEAITNRLGLSVSPRTVVADLAPGQQQLVEIARALSLRSRILILDEPTSSLTHRETDRLFDVIRNLKRDGISIIYISHRLKEVNELADRVVVLRDGRNAGELEGDDIDHDNIVSLMVGRQLTQFFHRTRQKDETGVAGSVLQVRDLHWDVNRTDGISLDLRAGEIVGMAGLMGAGRTELAETLFGVRPCARGVTAIDGTTVCIRKPTDAIHKGLFLVPEDRRNQGLILTDSVRSNISLPSLESICRRRLVSLRAENEMARNMVDRLNIRTPSIKQMVHLLSGGNQQKIVLAKWLNKTPRVLILDEPTRGVDVGAKSEIYAVMDQLAGQGIAILMISSDLEEILGMSDRVLVMHQGRLSGELAHDEMTEEAIMHLATGGSTGQ